MIDDRLGLPSASSMERILLCPGSFQMEMRLGDLGSTAAAKRGEKIHAAMEGAIPIDSLNYSDRLCAERLGFEEGKLVEKHGMEGSAQIKEQRIWLEKDGVKLFSGKPDVVHWNELGRRALVVNYKTGYYPPTPIAENVQMQAESVLFAQSQEKYVREVTPALIHPNAKLDDGSISQACTWNRNQLQDMEGTLTQAAIQAVAPEAPRNPGPKQCQWCKGKKNACCPEYLDFNS